MTTPEVFSSLRERDIKLWLEPIIGVDVLMEPNGGMPGANQNQVRKVKDEISEEWIK